MLISLSISDTIIVSHIGNELFRQKKGLYLSINKNGILKYTINQERAFLYRYYVFPTWVGKIEINAISVTAPLLFSFLLPLAVLKVSCVVLEREDTEKHT